MPDILGWLFFALWLLLVLSCTSLGWRIPIINTIIFRATLAQENLRKEIENEFKK